MEVPLTHPYFQMFPSPALGVPAGDRFILWWFFGVWNLVTTGDVPWHGGHGENVKNSTLCVWESMVKSHNQLENQHLEEVNQP